MSKKQKKVNEGWANIPHYKGKSDRKDVLDFLFRNMRDSLKPGKSYKIKIKVFEIK